MSDEAYKERIEKIAVRLWDALVASCLPSNTDKGVAVLRAVHEKLVETVELEIQDLVVHATANQNAEVTLRFDEDQVVRIVSRLRAGVA